jgi:predicted nucleotide-binding protein
VIDNCRRTLNEVTTLTAKYDSESAGLGLSATEDPASRRWKESLRANWKKLKWTMEGEKLDALKKDLHVHITALALFVNGQNRCVCTMWFAPCGVC